MLIKNENKKLKPVNKWLYLKNDFPLLGYVRYSLDLKKAKILIFNLDHTTITLLVPVHFLNKCTFYQDIFLLFIY